MNSPRSEEVLLKKIENTTLQNAEKFMSYSLLFWQHNQQIVNKHLYV